MTAPPGSSRWWPAFAGCFLACAGCAPVAGLRPPSALAQGVRSIEAGAAFAHVTPRPYVEEPSANVGQLWATYRAKRWLNLSAVTAFDSDAVAGGVAALGRFVATDRWVAAGEIEAGFAWGSASLSTAVRLFDDTWLYAAPRFGNWGTSVFTGLPAGLSATIYDGIFVRAEGQVSWVDFKAYNRRVHLAAGAGYAW